MIVVSDTSPLLYLLLIDQLELLPRLYNQVIVPQVVRVEMMATEAPTELREWIASPPTWFMVQAVTFEPDAVLQRLNPGEQAAIALAEQLKADLLLIDEKAGRQAAIQRGLRITGVLGILDQAATLDLIDLSDAITRLQQTNFRVSPRLIQTLLKKYCT